MPYSESKGGNESFFKSDSELQSDLDHLKLKSSTVTNESLESTRRMLAMAHESEATGAKTMEMLDEQGDKLKNTEIALDSINSGLRETDKILTKMEKIKKSFFSFEIFSSSKSKTKSKADSATSTAKGSKADQQTAGKSKIKMSSKPAERNIDEAIRAKEAVDGRFIQRITNDAAEDEMEENLSGISNLLASMKGQAIDMSTTLEQQNKMLDRMADKAENNNIQMQEATKRTKNLRK